MSLRRQKQVKFEANLIYKESSRTARAAEKPRLKSQQSQEVHSIRLCEDRLMAISPAMGMWSKEVTLPQGLRRTRVERPWQATLGKPLLYCVYVFNVLVLADNVTSWFFSSNEGSRDGTQVFRLEGQSFLPAEQCHQSFFCFYLFFLVQPNFKLHTSERNLELTILHSPKHKECTAILTRDSERKWGRKRSFAGDEAPQGLLPACDPALCPHPPKGHNKYVQHPWSKTLDSEIGSHHVT